MDEQPRRRAMVISRRWLEASLLTFVIGFTVLGFLSTTIYRDQPPIPGRAVDPAGRVVFTREDVQAGQGVFEKYALMEYGSLFGHGAILGPDFTAEYLHIQSEEMNRLYAAEPALPGSPSAAERVVQELHENRYDPSADILTFTIGQALTFETLRSYYSDRFNNPEGQNIVPPLYIRDPAELHQLTAYFAWSAWTATANRPGFDYSYTNNWPPERLAGNNPTSDALVWSVLSIIALLGGSGLVLFFFGRYDWLGWRGEESERRRVRFRPPGDVALSPGQRATGWFFLVVALLFLAQTLYGGLLAHYRADPMGTFYGLNLTAFLPYNLARTWHLQLAIFWVAAAYLGAGIFIAPLIAGHEPKGQKHLAYLLLVALVVVVVGSLLGEAASVNNLLGGLWFWIGAQGWEYLDLGRLWQVLLTVGLFFWAFIIFRGLRPVLRGESPGNMPYLFFYASLAIPVFYAVGLLADPGSGFAVVDFWRFWVVHLWVEDFLELFTTATVAYAFVLLGIISERVATRVIYLSILLYSLGGVIGTLHHLYFNGSPAEFMALGAFFSAMEVIPLLLLTFEAWSFLQIGNVSTGTPHEFPHRWAVMFLVAVGIWNFLGAGVFGFLINLPIVSYYEIGTNLTVNHGHTAMFGVYGMLAIALLLFALRYIVRPDRWSTTAEKISFWSLNVGLAWMAIFSLFPIGILQINDSVVNGYWHARSLEFVLGDVVHFLEWTRLPGDALMILGGTLPLVYLAAQAVRHPKPVVAEREPGRAALFTEEVER
ncbi:MAG: nitric-oxide reductase large subunit [Chloroflexota bacterium]|nr:MAG: nitric-oxide reductase large subunit [Chloroflexota bacterium]